MCIISGGWVCASSQVEVVLKRTRVHFADWKETQGMIYSASCHTVISSLHSLSANASWESYFIFCFGNFHVHNNWKKLTRNLKLVYKTCLHYKIQDKILLFSKLKRKANKAKVFKLTFSASSSPLKRSYFIYNTSPTYHRQAHNHNFSH